MQVLTEGLIRVRDEILALRQAREGFLATLEQETRDRRAAVTQMLAQFSKNFTEVAQRTKADRVAFLSGLKRTVSSLQREVRAEIGGVQQAARDLRNVPARGRGRGEKPGTQEAERGAGGPEDRQHPEAGPAEAPGPGIEGRKREGKRAKRQASPRTHPRC